MGELAKGSLEKFQKMGLYDHQNQLHVRHGVYNSDGNAAPEFEVVSKMWTTYLARTNCGMNHEHDLKAIPEAGPLPSQQSTGAES